MSFASQLPRVAQPPARAQVSAGAKFRPQSRIGKKLIPVPQGVDIQIDGIKFSAKGPKGQLTKDFHPLVTFVKDDEGVRVQRNAETKKASQMHGMARSIAANMVQGVAEGFQRKLQLIGVGYRASVSEDTLTLNLGYMYPVQVQMPEGVTAAVEKNTMITLSGPDNEILGNVAAVVRGKRPPEPYKGKGVRYLGEQVLMKAGKSGK